MESPSVSAKTHGVIEGWRSDKPVTAIMGEFSSGKSTLINFMLGEDVAATQVTATPLPPIWFTLTDEPFTRGLRRDGTLEDIDLGDDIDFRKHYAIIHRGMTCPVLAHCDMIDAPGISDPALHKDYLVFLARYMDFVVWCTPASQAWRQTEKVAFLKLPEVTREHSFMLITRFDKLRNAKDRKKVQTRVERDAGEFFADVVPIQTTKAADIPVAERTEDEKGQWVKTGGHAFEQAFTKAVEATAPNGDLRPLAPLEEFQVEEPSAEPEEDIKALAGATPEPAEEPKVEVVTPKEAASVEEAAEAPQDTAIPPEADDPAPQPEETGADEDLLTRIQRIENLPGNGQISEEIVHSIATLKGQVENIVSINKALSELIRIDGIDLDPQRLVSQIGCELSQFGDGGGAIRLDSGTGHRTRFT